MCLTKIKLIQQDYEVVHHIEPSRNNVLKRSGKHSNKALGIHHRLKEWACLDMTDALFIKKIISYINELYYILF